MKAWCSYRARVKDDCKCSPFGDELISSKSRNYIYTPSFSVMICLEDALYHTVHDMYANAIELSHV